MSMKTKKEIADIAYGLMITIGEIQNDMNRGDMSVTKEEIDNLYDMATDINEYFEK